MIVCMSRRICVELYRELVRLRPGWAHDDDAQGAIKVVMTGSASDPLDWQPHIRNKPRREALANRFRDPHDPLAHRAGARHVAHRVRRAEPPHDVRGQAHARARADAGHRAREPRVQGQAGRPRGGLPRAGARAQGGARHLHRERRHRAHGARPGGSGRPDAGEARGLLRALRVLHDAQGCRARLRPREVDERLAAGAALPAARRAGAHPRAGERQGPLPPRGAGAVAGVRAGRAARRGAAHPGRRRLLPGRAGGARQARAGRGAPRGGARPRRAADHLARRGPGRRGGHLRRGGTAEAGHLHPLRRVPRRGARHAAAQPRRRAAAEAA